MGKNTKWLATKPIKQSPRQRIGRIREDQACAYLTAQGLKLLQRNFLCKVGEIDLIMADQSILVFVEVRYRKQSQYGSAVETITWYKQQKIIRAAEFFLLKYKQFADRRCRFDVVAITDAANESLTWIKDAFSAG